MTIDVIIKQNMLCSSIFWMQFYIRNTVERSSVADRSSAVLLRFKEEEEEEEIIFVRTKSDANNRGNRWKEMFNK